MVFASSSGWIATLPRWGQAPRRVYRDRNTAPLPELPEIQAIVDGLGAVCVGRTVVAARALHPALVKSAAPGLEELVGRRLTGFWRRGKLIGIDLDGLSLVIHLMQSGRLSLAPAGARKPGKIVALTLTLDDGSELRLREAATEHRASVHVVRSDELEGHRQLAALGPEPLGLDWQRWRERLARPAGRLSNAIREGRRVAGIGRAYASDILWAARLPPFARTDRLTDEEWQRLANAADAVLSQALARAKAAITTDMPTNEGRVTAVHGHYGDPCLRCGRALERVSFEGYELVYCPDCQTGGKVYADRRLSRLLK